MPEQCGCKISAGYQIVGTENPRHVPPHIYEFCPLHARAAEMREVLESGTAMFADRGGLRADIDEVRTWLIKTRALLEETK